MDFGHNKASALVRNRSIIAPPCSNNSNSGPYLHEILADLKKLFYCDTV